MKDNGLIEFRWHGRGGQGAKTACLLLADAAFSSGKFVQGFPEYGPERMGAPITAYNRIIDARRISEETLGRNFPNTPMLSAAVKVSCVLEEAKFKQDMEESFHHKFATKPQVVAGNMAALVQAWEEVQVG